jgi:protein-disulfide isomerase
VAQSKRKVQSAAPSNTAMKSFYIALAVIALAGVGWIAYSLSGGGGATAIAPVDLQGLDDPQALLNAARGIELGESDAPVQVIVFSDFTCPACRNFNLLVEPQLKSELLASGDVRFTYYDYVLAMQPTGAHRHGFIAARAARCAGDQDRFWEMHDVLFARQQEWSLASSPVDRFVEYAGSIGLDTGAYRSCLASDRHADVVTANRMLGDNLGVRGTPTVYVAGRTLVQWSSYDALKAAVETELGRAVGQ